MVELYVNLFCVFQVFSKCVVILPSFRKQKREKLNKIFLKDVVHTYNVVLLTY